MKIKVEFELELPKIGRVVSRQELDEWINYKLGISGGMSMSNPLSDWDMEGEFNSMDWTQID